MIYGTFGLGVSVALWFMFLYAYYHEGNGVLAEASDEQVRESLFALLPGLFLAAVFLLGLFWTTLLTLWAVFVMPWSTLPVLIGIVAIIYYGGGYIRDAADETGSVSAVVTSAERVAESSLGRRTIDITTQSLGATIGGLGALAIMAVVFLVWLAAMVAILRNPIIMVAVFGVTLAYLGFIIFELLLEFVGGAVGGVSGVIVLGIWLPRVLLGDPSWLVSLGLIGIGFVVGWWAGAMAMTLIHKLGILVAGFITVSGWTFALAAGVRTISEFTSVSLGDYTGAVAVALLGGLIGAVLAWKAYVAFVIATTAFLGGVTIGGILLSIPVGTVVALTGALVQWILVRDNLEELAQIGAAEGDPEPVLATR